MAAIELLFNAVALFYGYRALQLLRNLWPQRQQLRLPPLTRVQKQIAEQLAFYVAVPPGIFVHELGHALSVLAFGGEIVRFRVYGYWGFVEHFGDYAVFERWFIALAGTLGSLLYSAALWFWASRQEAPFYRYAGLRSVRFHVYFTLIYYPVFTLATRFGDWRTIYDFGLVPLPAAVTLAAHVLLLGGFYWLDRRGGFAMPHFRSTAEAERFAALQARVEADPQDGSARLAYAEQLIDHGLPQRAVPLLQESVERQGDTAAVHLLLARTELAAGRQRSKALVEHLTRAVALGIPNVGQRVSSLRLLGEIQFEQGKVEEAMAALDRCIDEVQRTGDLPPGLARTCYQMRGVVARQTGRFAIAQQDLEQALRLAQASGEADAVAAVEQELATLANHRRHSRQPS